MFSIELIQKVGLSTPTISNNEPFNSTDDILTQFCEIIGRHQLATFNVRGFGQSAWPVDVETDLPIFLEQLPDFGHWLDKREEDFLLDFYEQGLERRLIFSGNTDTIKICCESWGNWQPTIIDEEISLEALGRMINNIIHVVDDLAIVLGLKQNQAFGEWKNLLKSGQF